MFLILSLTSISFFYFKVNASDNLLNDVKSAVAIELETGDLLYDYEAHMVRYPASTTKIMTIKLVMDAIKSGTLKKDDLLTTSKYASSMGGSQIFLAVNEQMKVCDLLKAVVIASANDAAVVLAEAIAGSEKGFVELMNKEAKRLKMNDTKYQNATGLHDDNHHTSAYDLSIIARELLLNYEDEIIPLSSTYEDYLRQDTNHPFWLVNTNKLIKNGSGIDGLKTGWTNQAGYCLVATKKANGMRIITVVMGASDPLKRNSDTMNLFNYVFANYEKQLISPKGSVVKTEEDLLKNPSLYNIILSQDIARMIKKNDQSGVITYQIVLDKKITNEEKGVIIGKLYVYIDNKLYTSVDLTLKEKIEKVNFFELLKKIIETVF